MRVGSIPGYYRFFLKGAKPLEPSASGGLIAWMPGSNGTQQSRYQGQIGGTMYFSFQVMVLAFALLGAPVIAVVQAPQGDFFCSKTVPIFIAFGPCAKLRASTSV